MSAFHDDKLWQEAYVATLDALDATNSLTGNDVIDQVRKHVMMVLTVIAQSAGERDRKMREIKLRDVGHIIESLRSLLSVLWGQEVFSDEIFEKLDGAYEALANKLPR
ncbi:hypothetical protein HY948_02015 [Candidatus Gottesmanbacteria bacterium]|nr:hypothetical protein [Candidatus Gottesmanbacteria bacterium]